MGSRGVSGVWTGLLRSLVGIETRLACASRTATFIISLVPFTALFRYTLACARGTVPGLLNMDFPGAFLGIRTAHLDLAAPGYSRTFLGCDNLVATLALGA